MPQFFTKPLNAGAPVEGEWDVIEQEREEIEEALARKAAALTECDAQRVLLLADQRRLFQRRNEILLRRAELKERGADATR
jgi:hypothetical protein